MSYQINNIWNFNISFDLNKNVSLESVSFSKWIKLQKKKKYWFIFKNRSLSSDFFITFYN